MEMKPVTSRAIASIGHDPKSGTLRVKFRNGGTYDYAGVSSEAHQALMNAPSIGRHHAQHMRRYSVQRVDG